MLWLWIRYPLMDEPFSALDARDTAEMQKSYILQEIKKTVVLTHDLMRPETGADIAIMRDGAIERTGTAMKFHPANEYVEKFLQGIDVSKILMPIAFHCH